MEKYTMFMDQKNQYSENEYTIQSNLQTHVYFNIYTNIQIMTDMYSWVTKHHIFPRSFN